MRTIVALALYCSFPTDIAGEPIGPPADEGWALAYVTCDDATAGPASQARWAVHPAGRSVE